MYNNMIKNILVKTAKLIFKQYSETPKQEIISGVRDNFIYGFIGAIIVVSITLKIDVAVLLAYLAYYFFLGKIVNRPKYITELGKFIIFPIPTAIGAFSGYKLAPFLINIFIN